MQLGKSDNPDDVMAAAARLDSRGDWTASIDLYRQAAQRWPEHGQYIQNCIDGVAEKQALAPVSQGRSRPRVGCGGCFLVVFLGMVAMFVWTGSQIYEPDRRADRVHQAIKPGASLQDVESLLTGRVSCSYQVKLSEYWQHLARSEFIDAMDATSTDTSPAMKVSLNFMGYSPYRVSFDVEFDDAGNVVNVTKPYGWD